MFKRLHIRKSQLREAQSGQSLIEMAIGMVILVMLMSGLLDFGRLFFSYLALEDAVGEAALFLSIFPQCADSGDDDNWGTEGGVDLSESCADPKNALWRAQNAVRNSVVDLTQIDITVYRPDLFVGASVRVTIDYDFTFLTPVVPQYSALNPIPLQVYAEQLIVSSENIPYCLQDDDANTCPAS
jgi:Flp pilus assembly protein TadG